MSSTPSWLDALQARNWREAEDRLYAGHAARPAADLDLRRLMFAQGLVDLGEWRLALDHLRACEPLFSDPGHQATLQALMTQACARLGELAQAARHGRQALALHDRRLAPAQSHGPLAISLSLYGANPKYCETALLNAEALPQVYRGATLLVFHDASVPGPVLARLKRHQCVELVDVASLSASHYPGTFWRFLALADPRFDVVLLRDADSVIGERERSLVERWLARPDKPFHVIRDWWTQTDLLLAGLWGARGGLLGGIRTLVDEHLAHTPGLHETHADQIFLAQCVWPRIRHLCLHHDSLFQVEGSEWPADLPAPTLASAALGGVDMVTYQAGNLPPGANYELALFDGQGELCRYRFPHDQPRFELPRRLGDRLRDGLYRMTIRPLIKVQVTDAAGRVTEQEI
jgi:hypothetical protein